MIIYIYSLIHQVYNAPFQARHYSRDWGCTDKRNKTKNKKTINAVRRIKFKRRIKLIESIVFSLSNLTVENLVLELWKEIRYLDKYLEVFTQRK